MIEFILQHRDTGMFLCEDEHWSELSRGALLFRNASQGLRFAESCGITGEIRLVVRVQRDKHYILMPLMDLAEDMRPIRRAA